MNKFIARILSFVLSAACMLTCVSCAGGSSKAKLSIYLMDMNRYMITQVDKLSDRSDAPEVEMKIFLDEDADKFASEVISGASSGEGPDIIKLDKINVPVVFVLGVAESTHKFDIQLTLREELMKNGYKISQIGTKRYSEFLNFHSFPSFMFDNISEAEKIYMFNNYVKYLEQKEQPDIIIIGIPGGIMKINNDYSNYFGIFAYEVSQALLPDFAILSTYYEDYTPDYFSKIANSIKYKFGYDVDCFNLSNIQFDWNKANDRLMDIYLTLESDFIDKKKKLYDQSNIPLYNILNRYDGHCLVELLIEKLQGYGRVASI